MNHYDTLEVSPKASAEVIRAAYKSLMQRHHPDKQSDAAMGNQVAAAIAQAYGVLSDPAKRATYDLQLQVQPTASSARPRAGSQARASTGKKGWQLWYAWGLIIVILITGGILLMQSKKQGRTQAPSQDARSDQRMAGKDSLAAPGTPTALPGLPGLPAAETPEQLMARTVLPFALDLSVTLPPANREAGNSGHVLTIAELGLRVGTAEPQRWIEKIQAQRQDILRQLMVQLSGARADELTKPEADLYLKGLIANTVAKAINLPSAPAPASPPVDPTQMTVQPIEVILPQGFRLR